MESNPFLFCVLKRYLERKAVYTAKIMRRREQREHIFKLLFMTEFNPARFHILNLMFFLPGFSR